MKRRLYGYVGCSVAGCERPHYGRTFCRLHWERNHKNGDPMKVQALHGPVRERLDHYSEPQGDCVVFTGYRDRNGYGHLTIQRDDTPAHRAAYEDAFGPIPEGLVVRHKCDNPPCIKLDHLEIGTHADNGNDKAVRDRSTYGERNPSAKLTEAQVRQIKLALARGVKQRALADQHGVSQSTIGRINRGYNWRRVDGVAA